MKENLYLNNIYEQEANNLDKINEEIRFKINKILISSEILLKIDKNFNLDNIESANLINNLLDKKKLFINNLCKKNIEILFIKKPYQLIQILMLNDEKIKKFLSLNFSIQQDLLNLNKQKLDEILLLTDIELYQYLYIN